MMPELPEVETIISTLCRGDAKTPSVIGLPIQSVRVFWSKTINMSDVASFQQALIGNWIINGLRRGKFIHFALDKGHLLIHLRMSGDLHLTKAFDEKGNPRQPANHDRVQINFTNDWNLVFNDPRKFGRMWFTHNPQCVYVKLGPEPLDTTLTTQDFFERLTSHKRQLKPLLLDQSFLAGLGNIYTDEALHRAKLHPLRSSNTISEEEAGQLLVAIRNVLQEGIQRNGASIDWVYRGGDFQNYFCVYQRTGEACPVCGTTIERIMVGQRGTHLCPQCQKINGPLMQSKKG